MCIDRLTEYIRAGARTICTFTYMYIQYICVANKCIKIMDLIKIYIIKYLFLLYFELLY